MAQTRIKVFVGTALLSVAVAVSGNNGPDPTLREIAGYQQWTRVTERPLPVSSSLAVGD